ncbi:MAG: hypothetical protein GY835_13995 [bacterium]|nr:hypothetical protein [bacterium]
MVKALRQAAFILVLFLLAVSLLPGCSGKSNEDVVATVNGVPIELGYFEAKWAKLASTDRRFEPTPENVDSLRQEVLEVLINKELIVYRAGKEGYLEEPAYLDAYKGQADFKLIEHLKDVEVVDKMPTFDEEDFKAHYQYVGIKIDGRHIDMDLLPEAEAVVKQLRDGELSFNEAVLRHSTNFDRHSGGIMATISFGSNIKPVEDVLFSMAKDEISDPVKTPYGYSIFVVDKIMTEEPPEYGTVRSSIEQRLKMRALRQMGARHSERVLDKHGFKFDWDVAQNIVPLMPDDPTPSQAQQYRSTNTEKPILKFTAEQLALVLYELDGNDFTLQNFSDEYDRLHPYGRPMKSSRLQGIYNWVHKDVVGQVMPTEARTRGYDKDPTFMLQMKEFQEQSCIGAVRRVLVEAPVVISDEDVQAYYDEFPLYFTLKDRIDCKQVVTSEEDDIQEAYTRLQNGDDADAVGRDLSVMFDRQWVSAAFTPDSTISDSPEIKLIQSMQNKGDFTKPFQYKGYWAIMIRNDFYPSELQDFEVVKETARAQLKQQKSDARMDSLLNVWRDEVEIVVNNRTLAKTEKGPEINPDRAVY